MQPHDTISCREEPLLSVFLLLTGNEAVSWKIVHLWAFRIPSWGIVLGAGNLYLGFRGFWGWTIVRVDHSS